MSKVDEYRRTLRSLEHWDAYLLENSGLPGPRGNLELAQVVADEGTPTLFERYLALDHTRAPVNSSEEFLAFCGVLGQGQLLAAGDPQAAERLRHFASDPRWRTREAVAMALQHFGERDMDALLQLMEVWSQGSLLEQRAAAAALCEPKLLAKPEHACQTLEILDQITASVESSAERKSENFRVLRQGLAYCWSVAVAAFPAEGKRRMSKWFSSPDADIRWIMRENLKKNRLTRMDPVWVAEGQACLEHQSQI